MSTSKPSLAAGLAGPLVVALALVALPALAVRPISDPSPWLHLKVGDYLASGGTFDLPDPWAPLASHAYQPTQWLPSIGTAWLVDSSGIAAIAWERAAGIALVALLGVLWAQSLSRLAVAVAAIALTLIAAWPSLTERPQLAGFVLLVPTLAAWWRTGHDRRPRWWLVPFTWVAASTHGIWAMGAAVGTLVTLSLLVTGSLTRASMTRLLTLLGGCALAAAVTPLGPRLLLTPFAVGSHGRQFVQEWMPSSVRSPSVMAALLMLALAWLLWVRTQQRPPAWQVTWWLMALVVTLSMQRTVPVGALMALPVLCSAAEAVVASRRSPALAGARPWVLVVAASLGIVLAVPVASATATEVAGVPAALTADLNALRPGTRVMVNGDTSGWMLFAAPQLRPVYDLRVESYSAQQVEDYIRVMAAEPGWDRILARSGASAALVPDDAPLRAALTEQQGWTETGSDAGLVLLEAPR
jgi:hypothetical protein